MHYAVKFTYNATVLCFFDKYFMYYNLTLQGLIHNTKLTGLGILKRKQSTIFTFLCCLIVFSVFKTIRKFKKHVILLHFNI